MKTKVKKGKGHYTNGGKSMKTKGKKGKGHYIKGGMKTKSKKRGKKFMKGGGWESWKDAEGEVAFLVEDVGKMDIIISGNDRKDVKKNSNSLTEMGFDYLSEQEIMSGGVNAAGRDVGAYNLINKGVGNTLTLLNGDRLLNSADYQTELLGGNFVPTLTGDYNLISSIDLDGFEILKDGASAIYGSNAVAGVVNNVNRL